MEDILEKIKRLRFDYSILVDRYNIAESEYRYSYNDDEISYYTYIPGVIRRYNEAKYRMRKLAKQLHNLKKEIRSLDREYGKMEMYKQD